MRNKIVLSCYILYVTFLSFGCVPGNRKLPQELREVSGVARLANGNTYWINDGGNGPIVFYNSIPRQNSKSFSVSLENVDWEGMSPYRDSLLCICDIGDNRQKRKDIRIAIVNVKGEILEQRKIFYPSTPYNAEACAIKGETFYVLTKSRIGKKGAKQESEAFLMTLDLGTQDSILTLKDQISFHRRTITDMAWREDDELVIVGYDYRRKALFPKTLTSIYSVEVDASDHFRQNTLRERKVLAPFIWTQYESILPINEDEVMIASEKTALFAPRWRILKLPR